MATKSKWWRVIDPISPLYGCDVRGDLMFMSETSSHEYIFIEAMRRIDIFVGDRPFQLIAPSGEDLGLLINSKQLQLSPLQDDLIELSTDPPYGEFLEELELSRGDVDNCILHLVAYEKLYQVALLSRETGLVGRPKVTLIESRTVFCDPDEIRDLRSQFEEGLDVEGLINMIRGLGEI